MPTKGLATQNPEIKLPFGIGTDTNFLINLCHLCRHRVKNAPYFNRCAQPARALDAIFFLIHHSGMQRCAAQESQARYRRQISAPRPTRPLEPADNLTHQSLTDEKR